MVTAGTYQKSHLFRGPERLTLLRDQLLKIAAEHGWQLQAWAIFSNHYHFVTLSPVPPTSLRRLIQELHSVTARDA